MMGTDNLDSQATLDMDILILLHMAFLLGTDILGTGILGTGILDMVTGMGASILPVEDSDVWLSR